MDSPGRALWTAAILGFAVLAGYSAFLSISPVYVAHDEVLFALQAHSIASTGHDLSGTAFPLYFPLLKGYWAQPFVIYFTALVLKLLPLSEAAIRLPTSVVGAADVALMYLVARQLFARDSIALVAAGMLALTPTHFLISRLAVDALYPLPFVLVWLLCFLEFRKRPAPWLIVVASATLGIGIYTYVAAVVMMPLYFGLTCIVLFRSGARLRLFALAAAAFLLPLLPFFGWLVRHPGAHVELLSRYRVGTSALPPLHVLVERLSLYWNCLDPAFLFASAADNPVNTTFRAGVFLFPMAAFAAAGAAAIMNSKGRGVSWLLVAGVLSAPLGVVIVGERTIPRLIFLLPFAVLIAAAGFDGLLASRGRFRRAAAIVLLASLPVQFAYYAHDYFTDYRRRSGAWFEHNRREAFGDVMTLASHPNGRPIYLAGDIPWVDEYWRFFSIALKREDLLDRSVTFDPREVWTMPAGSVILTTHDSKRHDPRAMAAGARHLETVADADGYLSFSIFER